MDTTQTNNKSRKITTRDLVLTAMFTAVICVLSQIVIPTQPIPFSLGLLAIFLTGVILTPRNAFLAVLVYLLLGAFGLPVFANFKGGIQQLAGNTGGYLAAYPLMALITSLSYKFSRKYRSAGLLIGLSIGMVISLLLCYLIGTMWFTYLSGNSFYVSLTLCVFPFVLFDLFKIAIAIAIGIVIRRAVAK